MCSSKRRVANIPLSNKIRNFVFICSRACNKHIVRLFTLIVKRCASTATKIAFISTTARALRTRRISNVPANKVSVKCRYHMYDRKLLFFSLAFRRTEAQFIQDTTRTITKDIKNGAFAGNILSEATVCPGRLLSLSLSLFPLTLRESEIRNAIVLRGAFLE